MVSYRSGDTIAAQAAGDTHTAITGDHGGGTAAAMSAFLRGSTRWQHDPEVALEALEESITLTKAGAGGPWYGSALSLIVRLRLPPRETSERRSHVCSTHWNTPGRRSDTSRASCSTRAPRSSPRSGTPREKGQGPDRCGWCTARHIATGDLAGGGSSGTKRVARTSECGARRRRLRGRGQRGAAMTDDEAVDYCVDALEFAHPCGLTEVFSAPATPPAAEPEPRPTGRPGALPR